MGPIEAAGRLRRSSAFGHVSRLAGASAAAQAIQLLAAPLLTRLFDVAAIGAWTLFSSIVASLATLATARYEYAIVLPRRHAEAVRVLQLCLTVCALSTLLCATGVVFVHWGWPEGTLASTLGMSLVWLPLCVAASGAMQSLSLWHNRLGHFRTIARARVALPLVTTLLQLAAAGARLGAPGLVAAHAVGALAGPLSLLQFRRLRPVWRLPRWSLRRLWSVAVRYRKFPLINTPHAFVNALQETLAIGVVAALAGPVAAGHYGLMMRLVKAPASLIGQAVSEVLFGALARSWAAGADIRPLLMRVTGGLLLAALLPALALLAFGPWLFGTLLGSDWAHAGGYAQWLVPYLMAHFVVGPLTVTPMVMGRQGSALLYSMVGNVLYVVTLAAALLRGAALDQALGLVSAVQVLYFVAYWGWLLRSAGAGRAQHHR